MRYVIGLDRVSRVPREAQRNSKKRGSKEEGDRVYVLGPRQKEGVASSVTK